ncbi:MAG: hypothetical protein IT370_11880 [Deltaproteobacteria bacterium]|nr:hypothetical protein [Deltaproteobacteria bacterium]
MLLMLMALPGVVAKRQDQPLPVSAWVGAWRGGDDSLIITREGKGVRVVGTAVWHGWGDNTHEGAFDGAGPVGSRQIELHDKDDSSCVLVLYRVGDELWAEDPGQGICGGVNVTFSGRYQRK